MTENAVLLNIGEMIDLAIGTPEVGVVDFNMLQTVLHCLAQQMRVLGKNVEVRGSLVSVPVSSDNAQTINITEYAVDTDANKPVEKKMPSAGPPALTEDKTILVVERVKKSDSLKESSPPLITSTATQRKASAVQAPPALPLSALDGPPHVASQEKLSLVTISKFNILENTVEDLKSRVYGSMPKNEEILQEVRSQTNIKAIQDMWTNLNVSSRLEAAEGGINKLSSLVQDLIKETTDLQDAIKHHASQTQVDGTVPSMVEAIPATTISTTAAPISAISTTAAPASAVSTTAAPVPGPALASKDDLASLYAVVNQLRDNLDHLTQAFYSTMKELQTSMDLPQLVPPPPPQEEKTYAPPPPLAPVAEEPKSSSGSNLKDLMERMNDLERRLTECCDKLGKADGIVSDQLNSFQDQLEYLAKQVANLSAASQGTLSPDLIKDLQGLMQLFQTVQDMQAQLKKVHETALQLAAEKEDRQSHVDALLEQIELLKTIKLDREDMTEAMAEKADLRMLARKVSHDQFEIACNDLSKGLEHALGKLNTQESLWQQALDDIQREIETKLDKMELSPVKDFFNNKLKQLQEHLKQMASLRREAEAAGTKRKLLRDLNCLSCDANATMAAEATNTLPLMPPLPTTMSMKPYLSYELDAIRKAQASSLPQRNMHDWENIDKQMQHQSAKPQRVRSGTNKHLCNRYCGGSHTTTTPAQRVARVGHFIKQWGPDVLPLSSGLAAGDDGRMYRVTEGASVGPDGAVDQTCTPKSPKIEKPELPDINMNEQCRCLEAPGATGH